MVKKILAIAVVNRIKPKLSVKDIYSLQDGKEVKLGEGEIAIRVEISPLLVPKRK